VLFNYLFILVLLLLLFTIFITFIFIFIIFIFYFWLIVCLFFAAKVLALSIIAGHLSSSTANGPVSLTAALHQPFQNSNLLSVPISVPAITNSAIHNHNSQPPLQSCPQNSFLNQNSPLP
jgi:hypothetical protein